MERLCIFLCKKLLILPVTTLHHLAFFFSFVYNYTSCLANDIQTLMALKVTLNAMDVQIKNILIFFFMVTVTF